jgi:hypothetical protein
MSLPMADARSFMKKKKKKKKKKNFVMCSIV